ncbi:hypothetical protein pb186bvf_005995 [Paramecium bursaria]
MSFGPYAYYQVFGQSQELENILKEGNVSLEDLLERENFLNDIKAGALNAFAEYVLRNPEVYERLLQYIVLEIQDDRKQKLYPYVISEIFALEHIKLIEYLYYKNKLESQTSLQTERLTTIEDDLQDDDPIQMPEDEDIISGSSITYVASQKSRQGLQVSESIRQNLLAIFFSFLDQETLNETSVGYYSKVLNAMIRKNGGELWDHIMQNTDILVNLLKHIQYTQFVELISKLIVLEVRLHEQVCLNTRFMRERKQVVEILINQFQDQKDSVDTLDNLSQILITVLQTGQDYYEQMRDIFDLILSPGAFFDLAKKTGAVQLFRLICEICKFLQYNNIRDKRNPQFVVIIQSITNQIKFNDEDYITTYGRAHQVFGQRNLFILMIIRQLIAFKQTLLYEAMLQSDVINFCLILIERYEWNNQLVLQIQQIFTDLLMDDRINKRILQETQLLNFIFKYKVDSTLNDKIFNKPIKYGFGGCLNVICKLLLKLGTELPQKLQDQIAISLNLEEQFICQVDPKTHLEEAPPEISIDRQVEMQIDNNQKEDKK